MRLCGGLPPPTPLGQLKMASITAPRPATAAADIDLATAGPLQTLSKAPLAPMALAYLGASERLLLAQAVHEAGKAPPDWAQVSSLLLAHPLIAGASSEQSMSAEQSYAFGAKGCERAWVALMRQRGLVESLAPDAPAKSQPKPRTDRQAQLALSQLLYVERMKGIEATILQREARFK